jgi:hypothetical protein
MSRQLKAHPLGVSGITTLIFIVALSVVGIAISGPSNGNATSPPDSQTSAQLRAAIIQIAKANGGEPAPSQGRVVRTTRRDVNALVIGGGELPFDDEVFAVVVRGNFSITRHPPGKPAPTGKFLTVTFDAATLEARDLMLTQTEPMLEQLGTAVSLGL